MVGSVGGMIGSNAGGTMTAADSDRKWMNNS